jgi:hypothetical protein
VMHYDVHAWLDRHQQVFKKLQAEENVV